MKSLAVSGAVVALLCGAGPRLRAQEAPAGPLMPANVPSTLLRPALSLAGRDLDTVHAERWKLNPIVRDQTASDLRSIQRDLSETLPPLLIAADRSPGVTLLLPVSRNVNALYNVLLRMVERGRTAAPQEQESALEQARESLDTARRAFDDNLQAAAEAEARMLAAPPPPPPPVPPPPVPEPPAKKKPKTKPKPKPVAPS